ncbi:MAG: hypothetical protein JSU86_04190 [Phycisphaerales bacterium]|nr:MAG: hypothetical protein JSU86_04190 [Phycisphaerales bacterium]
MNRIGFGKSWLACAALLAGGCGAIPDIIADAARSSAKEALQEAVEDVVDDVIDNTVGELLDFGDFEFPFVEQSEDEVQDGDAFEDEDEDAEESDQDTGRAGRTAYDGDVPQE